ncbi:hypothetical protein C8J56DRAFT_1032930 [Mycena floridula]|nr:hypothetical protein C8J56DRAFT_1032930 [Mycena floridula]
MSLNIDLIYCQIGLGPPFQPHKELPQTYIDDVERNKKRARAASSSSTIPDTGVPLDMESFVVSPHTTPPRSTKKAITVWKSLDPKTLRATMGKGGINLPADELLSQLDGNISYNIRFYCVAKVGLDHIISKQNGFELQESQHQHGVLEIVTKYQLGQGAFKSANKGLLTIHGATLSADRETEPWAKLGQSVEVAVKRFFYVTQESKDSDVWLLITCSA